MRILIDMDDVMADAVARFLEWYERDFGIRYTKQDLVGTKLIDIVPEEHRGIVKNYPHQKGFFKNLPLIPDSREVIQELYNNHEVFVASAAMEFRYSMDEKFEWLENHFPFIHWRRRIFCGDKHLLKADVLIDDHDFNLTTFEGRAIMFTAPHNMGDKRYERLDSWLDARKLFELY